MYVICVDLHNVSPLTATTALLVSLHVCLYGTILYTYIGTSVLRDFVELPSQLYEHWLSEPTVLNRHARHFQTGTFVFSINT